jgi:hypothetical protein
LIALDGIFLAELGVSDVFTKIQRRKGKALKSYFPLGDRLLEALIRALLFVAGHLPSGESTASGELRRHKILHGVDPSYGTEKASVQGVLLLEVLHFQLEARDSEMSSS